MDLTQTTFCLNAFDEALSSPIGKVISSYYQMLPTVPSDQMNILSIQNKLINHFYSTPRSFLSDFENTVFNACRFFGLESDISIAILSFQHSIHQKLNPILNISEETWKNSVNSLFDQLKKSINIVPNDVESYKILSKPIERKPIVDTEDHPTFPNPQLKIDLLELKSNIERFMDDSDNYEMMDIIEHYQPELSNIVGNVKFDLKLLHPHTLFLISEFVKTRKLKSENDADKLQRSNSTPIKSQYSSTIILPNPNRKRENEINSNNKPNTLPNTSNPIPSSANNYNNSYISYINSYNNSQAKNQTNTTAIQNNTNRSTNLNNNQGINQTNNQVNNQINSQVNNQANNQSNSLANNQSNNLMNNSANNSLNVNKSASNTISKANSSTNNNAAIVSNNVNQINSSSTKPVTIMSNIFVHPSPKTMPVTPESPMNSPFLNDSLINSKVHNRPLNETTNLPPQENQISQLTNDVKNLPIESPLPDKHSRNEISLLSSPGRNETISPTGQRETEQEKLSFKFDNVPILAKNESPKEINESKTPSQPVSEQPPSNLQTQSNQPTEQTQAIEKTDHIETPETKEILQAEAVSQIENVQQHFDNTNSKPNDSVQQTKTEENPNTKTEVNPHAIKEENSQIKIEENASTILPNPTENVQKEQPENLQSGNAQ
ncbi:hypothetical protein TRFO_25445 [Tritrichomonas foetus]|uniref:Uncharacterized protein n=1 Tax=Tritrichomonas foetus TaxID=1144522 RepID=A0A1J4K528_9EUKA|nr:hypothetical protein TRFO_25445 [Tritrichomonas foetus]|eukprot:OHT06495.1 hypothetical protein TRFO_25445 [Tritrichomonas foetus]